MQQVTPNSIPDVDSPPVVTRGNTSLDVLKVSVSPLGRGNEQRGEGDSAHAHGEEKDFKLGSHERQLPAHAFAPPPKAKPLNSGAEFKRRQRILIAAGGAVGSIRRLSVALFPPMTAAVATASP